MNKTVGVLPLSKVEMNGSSIIEKDSASVRTSRNPYVGTPQTIKVSSVHERRCKADEVDEIQLASRDGGSRGAPSRDSRKSEIKSRISGKQTAESQQ